MPKKKLVIKKEDLEEVKETVNAFYDSTDKEDDETYEQWRNACVKAFPINYYETEWDVLKSMGIAIRNKPINIWVKVYQALGYKVE